MSFYVTTPIYYVNAQPHLGHAYTTIAADVLARHMRQRGEDVFFLTGTDEHGEPVADVAEREGVAPRELADRNVVHFKEMGARVNASNDFFIRTSDPEHAAVVQGFMQGLYDGGHIYPGTYEGWYCPRCADFKNEHEIVDGNKCPIHKIELNWEKEDNYFFRLSAFQEPLERLYAEQPDFVMPRSRYNEAAAFIRQGLEDVSCTRARLRWGVKAPWDESQVFYVWFDALLNYLSALAYAREGEDLTERYWPADFHLIGKDILKFHGVIWPAMLIAAGVELPRHLFVHGFLLMQGEKMSKSLGNVLDPFRVMDVFGTDALRYYCLREVSFGQDGSVSTEGFEARYNSELANEYGNLASRTLAMIARYRDGVVPASEPSAELAGELDGLADAVRKCFDRAEMTAALEEIWARGVRRLNRYVEEQAPWALAKGDESERLDEVLYSLAEGLRVISVLLHPYMPETTTRLLDALGQDDVSLDGATFGARSGGATVGKLPPLFPKVEPAQGSLTPRQLAMLAGVSAIWGASYLLIKIALDGIAPSMIVFARVLLAALLLYAVILIRGGEDRAALRWLRRHPRRTLVQGTLAVATPFMLISLGETQISSGLTGVLISPGPLFIALLAPMIDPTEKVDRRAGLGVAIGFGGVALLIGVDAIHSTGELLGALAMVGAALAYGVGAMYARLKFRGVPPLVISFAACGVAALLTLPPALATLGENSPDGGEIAAVVSLGVIGTAVAFYLYFGLIAEVGAGRAALCGYLIPPLALAYGAILLDEEITPASIAGLVLILAGVALASGERQGPAMPVEAAPGAVVAERRAR